MKTILFDNLKEKYFVFLDSINKNTILGYYIDDKELISLNLTYSKAIPIRYPDVNSTIITDLSRFRVATEQEIKENKLLLNF